MFAAITERPDPCSNSAFHKRCLSCSKPLPCRIIAWITQNSLDWLQPIFLLMRVIKETLSSRGRSTGFCQRRCVRKTNPALLSPVPMMMYWTWKITTSHYVHGRNLANHLGSIQQTSPVNRGKTRTSIKWCRIYSINIMKRVILETFHFFHQSEDIRWSSTK